MKDKDDEKEDEDKRFYRRNSRCVPSSFNLSQTVDGVLKESLEITKATSLLKRFTKTREEIEKQLHAALESRPLTSALQLTAIRAKDEKRTKASEIKCGYWKTKTATTQRKNRRTKKTRQDEGATQNERSETLSERKVRYDGQSWVSLHVNFYIIEEMEVSTKYFVWFFIVGASVYKYRPKTLNNLENYH